MPNDHVADPAEPDPGPAELLAELHRWLQGPIGLEDSAKAVKFLATTPWLEDAAFVDRCVVRVQDRGVGMALIDWLAIPRFAEDYAGRADAEPTALEALHTTFLIAKGRAMT